MSTVSRTTDRPFRRGRSPARPTCPAEQKARWRPRKSRRGQTARIDYRDVVIVLFVGAVTGLYFGLKCEWQIAVESAQALAGVVSYPAGNPFYMYHVKAWTLLHQLPALLLASGVSDRVVSMLVACAASILIQQALGLICYAFSRDRLVACAVPMLYLATNVCKGCGGVYPLFVVPEEYWTSYGVTGTACTLYIWALWGLGLRRPAALLCGLVPAVHPALGGWCVVASAVALCSSAGRSVVCRLSLRERAPFCGANVDLVRLTPLGRWFAAGALVSALSYAAQQYIARGLPAADPSHSRQLLTAFVEGWDNHRVPFPLGHIDCQFGWIMLMLLAVAQAWFARKLPREARLLLRILLVSAFGSLLLCVLTHFSERLPLAVMLAMPGRFINLAVVAYPAVLVGLLARWRRVWPLSLLLSGLALFCLLRTLMLSKQLIYVPYAYKVFIASGLMAVYLLASYAPSRVNRGVKRFAQLGTLAGLALAGWLWRSDLHLACLFWACVPALWFLREKLRQVRLRAARPFVRGATLACLWFAFAVKGGWLLGLGCLLAVATLRRRPAALKKSFAKRPRIGTLGDTPSPLRGGLIVTLRRAQKNWQIAAAAASLLLIAVPLVERARAGARLLDEAEYDPVMVAARRESSMLLATPRMCLVQLRTRRPVLLNGEAMNQITYVPASGPAMNEIVKRVYGDDILVPRPRWWRNWGGLMDYSGYELWQSRSRDDWSRLGREFGFTQIVAWSEWKLQLPVAARSEKLVLYDVP